MIGHKHETLGCSVIGGKLAVQWTEQGVWNGNWSLFIRVGSCDKNDAKAISSYGSHRQAIEYKSPQAVHLRNGTFQDQQFFQWHFLGTYSLYCMGGGKLFSYSTHAGIIVVIEVSGTPHPLVVLMLQYAKQAAHFWFTIYLSAISFVFDYEMGIIPVDLSHVEKPFDIICPLQFWQTSLISSEDTGVFISPSQTM